MRSVLTKKLELAGVKQAVFNGAFAPHYFCLYKPFVLGHESKLAKYYYA